MKLRYCFFSTRIMGLDYGMTSCAVFRHRRVIFFFTQVALLVRAISATPRNRVGGDTLRPAWGFAPMLPEISGTVVGFGSGF